jgi:hypothetical protein
MEAQQRLYGHLRHLTPEQRAWIEMLLAEGEQALPNEQKVVRAEAIAMLAQMFTTEDWQAIAHVASQTMTKDILQMGQEAAVPTLVT